MAKNKGQTRSASAPEFNRRLIVELKRELDLPCGLRTTDQSEGCTWEIDIWSLQLHIVERVQEVAPELDVFGFGYMNILQNANVRICETRPSLGSL